MPPAPDPDRWTRWTRLPADVAEEFAEATSRARNDLADEAAQLATRLGASKPEEVRQDVAGAVEGLGNLARDLGRGMSEALEALLEPSPPRAQGREPSHPAFWSPELVDQPSAVPGQGEEPSAASRGSPSDVASSMRGGVSALTQRTHPSGAEAQAAREGKEWGPLEEAPGSRKEASEKERRSWDPGAGGP